MVSVFTFFPSIESAKMNMVGVCIAALALICPARSEPEHVKAWAIVTVTTVDRLPIITDIYPHRTEARCLERALGMAIQYGLPRWPTCHPGYLDEDGLFHMIEPTERAPPSRPGKDA